ncbi:type II secretion system protein GspG [Streptomyces umbrinus]|uniref:type II secretion system protein GspG n=1 Tax=Streptomyces umbrinus TaxID=67370 RepID=UPI0033CECE9F
MAELRNSTREIRKATYVPITLQPEPGERPAPQPLRALDKVAFLRALAVTPAELRDVTLHGTRVPVALATAVTGLAADPPTASTLRQAPALAGVDVAAILSLAVAVTTLRREHDATVTAVLHEIVTAEAEPGRGGPVDRLLDTIRHGRALLQPTARAAVPVVLPSAAALAAAVHQAVATSDERIVRLRALGYDVEHPRPPQRGTRAASLVDAFNARMALQPVGRLHLERLEMSPAGIEKGELVASVPLAPQETVNISHQEWATGSEEFEKIVQDVFEAYSEQGVAEKKELSQATDSQRQHATAFTLSGRYSYAGQATVAVNYRRSSQDTQAAKDSSRESKDLTAKASARTTTDHKTSFTVRSAYGTRDETVRRIRNPSDTDVMRLDYYQMMRRWRVDLLRYDARLTYDLVIPAPGAELTDVLDEIAAIDAALAKPFSFPVQPADIDPTTWEEFAATYGGRVSPPPLDPPPLRVNEAIPWRSSGESATPLVLTLQIPIGDDVEVAAPSTFRSWYGTHNWRVYVRVLGESMDDRWNEEQPNPSRVESWCDLDGLIGKSGDVPVIYEHRYASHGAIIIELTLRATQASRDRWRFETWQILHDAAEEHYFQARQVLADRREQLLAGLRGWDALTLRQLEREAIMKGVLRWILGPGFTFGPPGITTPLGEAVIPTAESWLPVLEYGEFAKFVHQAIEWENVLFFLYPYFWDERPETADKRLLLQHPDTRHREFLRAGSARVVLTVRPGFEAEFTRLMETGLLTPGSEGSSPYMTIAEEIANFARTNYPGIPPANPERNYRPLLTPQQRAAWRDIQRLIFLLDAVGEVDGEYPDQAGWFERVRNHAAVLQSAGTLDANGELWDPASLPATDPWGNAWRYSHPGVLADYDLATFGADGTEGGEGLNGDITSWAEASLIARWYEYTPTGAMDVSINTDLDDLA